MFENVWFCPICKSQADHHHFFRRSASKWWQDNKIIPLAITYAICDQCGAIFLWDRLNDDAANDYYMHGNYRRSVQGTPEITERVLTEQTRRVDALMPEMDFEEVKCMLDVGASTGLFLKAMQDKYGCECYGIEPGEHFRNKSEFKMFSDLSILNSPDWWDKFDLITIIHTLEHMNDPLSFLVRLHEFTSGHILIEVPNVLKESCFTVSHPICFTPDTLTLALNMTGWEIVWLKEFYDFKTDRTLPANILVKAKPGTVNEFIPEADIEEIRATFEQNWQILEQDREKFEEQVHVESEGNWTPPQNVSQVYRGKGKAGGKD